jgi:N-methylhydantoinase A
MRVGIEVGGTFTDMVLIADDGDVQVFKVPSTPQAPDEAAYAALGAAGIEIAAITELAHGSTVATNAVLERDGARTAFIVSRGFRDLLFLQRHDRRNIFDLSYQKPMPMLRRKDCFEVTERILSNGTVASALEIEEVEKLLVPALAAEDFEAIAICLLNAYRNSSHEQMLAQTLRKHFGDVFITTSSDIAPEFREYERASTTVIAAKIQPVVATYLSRFEKYLERHKFKGQFTLMQSNGGRLPSIAMRNNPVTALFSGPAAGVMGAIRQAGLSGFRDLITFDMGGTSTDVCLVEDGAAEICAQTNVDGLPVRIPMFDIVSVGAGCGSIVWIDDGGMLRVGPQSAGAEPGPACYDRGGQVPTVTDAHVIRGTIRPEAFLGGDMSINADAGALAFKPIGVHFQMSPEEIAESAVKITDANVVRAIQLISTERGRDPRDHVLVAYGGAGPLHACRIAEELGISTVLVPPFAGVLSAVGLLAADSHLFATTTHRIPIDESAPATICQISTEMVDSGRKRAEEFGLKPDQLSFDLVLDMRHVGQAFEVSVPLDMADLEFLTAQDILGCFTDAHQKAYAHPASSERAVEIVTLRLKISAPAKALPRLKSSLNGYVGKESRHEVFDDGRRLSCQLITRAAMGVGLDIEGPAILDDVTSTIYVRASWQATVDENLNLMIRRLN